jgi:hypothetical protein
LAVRIGGEAGGLFPARDGDRPVLGVVGTLVWDTIRNRDIRVEAVEEWGGIGYALEALTVSLPEEWEILPLLRVGRDLAEPALRYLRELPRVRVEPGVVVVPHPNNRVELVYRDGVRITERLSGGVPSWGWPQLSPLLDLCDALYVNFISGFEMELETARGLKHAFQGPIWADLHSLFLGVGAEGVRVPRPLPAWADWLHSFDAVQMNEDEFHLLGDAVGDPWALAGAAVGADLDLLAVTLGARGCAYVARGGFRPDPATWPGDRGRMADPAPARSGRVAAPEIHGEGDTTGCGDVWGSTAFGRLLAGDTLEAAFLRANEMAARNVGHRGARGLRHHLAGRVAPGGR